MQNQEGDLLVVDLDGTGFALDTRDVASIVETERIPFLPGRSGFITGIISLRGEPVAVVDLRKVFKKPPKGGQEEGPLKVVVVRGKNRILGLDIGSAAVSFMWKEDLKGKVLGDSDREYTKGKVDLGTGAVQFIDWGALFDKASGMLSTEGTGA